MEINKNEQLMLNTVGENDSEYQQQQRDSRHDRVVIVAGNHSGGSGGDSNVRNRRNAPQTQWKNTRGILKNSYGGRTHPDAS